MDYKRKIVVSRDQFDNEVVPALEKYKHIISDLESTGFSFLTEKICGIGLAVVDDDVTTLVDAWYIPTMHHENMEEALGLTGHFFTGPYSSFIDPEYVFSEIRRIFLMPGKIIVYHNLKFDMQFLINEDIDLRPKLCLPPWNVTNPEKIDAAMDPKGWRDYLTRFIAGIQKEAECADTMVMSWLIDENKPKHGLKDLAKTELGIDMTKLDKILKGKRFNEADARETFPYALLDPVATAKLFIKYYHKLKEMKLWDVFWRVEMPFVGVLQGMERRGMPVNVEVLKAIGERCQKEMAVLQEKIFSLAGKVFNLNAGQQLAVVLHDECGLPVLAKTDKGSIKVDADTLEKLLELGRSQPEGVLKERHFRGLDIIDNVLKFRKITKVYGTYVEGMLDKIDTDGRIRAGFHHTGTVTGRLSSSGPNLQNLPSGPIFTDYISVEEYQAVVDKLLADNPSWADDGVALEVGIQKHFMFTVAPVKKNDKNKWEVCKDKEAEAYEIQWKIRDAFQEILRQWWLVVGDLSQMELRMTAHLTGDSTMTQGFIDGHDIHQYNASIIYAKALDEVTKVERRDAKAVSFGLVYGKTVRGFAVDWYGNEPDFWIERPSKKNEFGEINKKYLKMAQKIVDDFFGGFPDVAKGIEQCHIFLEKYGYVKTITGRYRRIPEVFSPINGIKNRAKRQAFNARVQGSSADYLKMAMIKLEREMYIFQDPDTTYEIGQIAQVHDELMAPTPPEKSREVLEMVEHYMENVIQISCPIKADVEVGWKYGSCK